MKQVTWPSREEVISTTTVVIATVAFFGVFLAVVDWLVQRGVYVRLQNFRRLRGIRQPMAMQWYIIHALGL